MPEMKYIFFTEICKSDYKLSKTFYRIKISYVLVKLWIILCDVLCHKVVISSYNSYIMKKSAKTIANSHFCRKIIISGMKKCQNGPHL